MVVSHLAGKEFLVTAGANRAPIDSVRYISNRSTGKLATEVALELLRRGAFVTFLHGTDSYTPERWLKDTGHDEPSLDNYEAVEVETLFNLVETVERLMREAEFDAVIHAMAVLDYIPDSPTIGKTKSGMKEWTLTLIQTPKVISMFKRLSPNTLLVGFKMEVGASPEELRASADALATQNQCEIVVANDMAAMYEGKHVAHIYRPGDDASWQNNRAESKQAIAGMLCDELTTFFLPAVP